MEDNELEPTVFPVTPAEPELIAPLGNVPSFEDTKEAAASETSASSDQQPEEAQVAEEKRYTNPNARARILEREKVEMGRRLRDLEIKLERALAAKAAEDRREAEADSAEEEPDLETSPAKALYKKIESVERELKSAKESQVRMSERSEREAALSVVGSRMSEHKDDPVLNAALVHIGNIMKRNIERQHPDKTHAEQLQIATNAAQEMYVAWVKSGKDPVEETVSLAVDYGMATGPALEQGKKAQSKPANAKAEISADRERAAATASLGAAPGKSPGKTNISRLVDGTEDEFAFRVRNLQRDGVIKKGRLGVPSFGDLARAASSKQ